MSKIGEFTIIDILDELIGGIEPIGETTYDAKAEYNLKKWAYVASVMVERLEDVANISCNGDYSIEKVKNIAKKEFKEIAESILSHDAEIRPHGHWINHKEEHTCSACDMTVVMDSYNWVDDDMSYDYCPYCGARMDGERKEENNK